MALRRKCTLGRRLPFSLAPQLLVPIADFIQLHSQVRGFRERVQLHEPALLRWGLQAEPLEDSGEAQGCGILPMFGLINSIYLIV